MNALILRYGMDKCEKVLKEIKLVGASHQQRVVNMRRDVPMIIDVQWPDMSETLSLLLQWCLTDTFPDKLSLRLSGAALCNEDNDRVDRDQHCEKLWKELQKYAVMIRNLQSVDPSSGSQRVQSRFHTLHLQNVFIGTFNLAFRDKELISLFEKVSISGDIKYSEDLDVIVNLVVDEGMISSLNVEDINLDDVEGKKFAEMLGTNRLQSLEINAKVDSTSFAHALVESLNRHVQTFAEASILRDLDLDNSLGPVDRTANSDLFKEVLNVIGILPNLNSFGIRVPSDCNSLQILVGAIAEWNVCHFKLWCGKSRGSDLKSLLDAVGNSKHLKVFSMSCHYKEVLSDLWTRQLFDLALSTTSGLLEIHLPGFTVRSSEFSTLIPDDCDPAVACKRRLRRFGVVLCDFPRDRWTKLDYPVMFEYVLGLSRLLSKHLPFLHNVGLTIEDRTQLENRLRENPDLYAGLFQVWNEVWERMALNRVGMGLLQSDLPTVPGGLWPIVLHHATAWEENPALIYKMVRALVEQGHVGPTETPMDAGRKPLKRSRHASDS